MKVEKRADYEPPKLIVVGKVVELTLHHHDDKRHGPSDGLTFLGNPITHSS